MGRYGNTILRGGKLYLRGKQILTQDHPGWLVLHNDVQSTGMLHVCFIVLFFSQALRNLLVHLFIYNCQLPPRVILSSNAHEYLAISVKQYL